MTAVNEVVDVVEHVLGAHKSLFIGKFVVIGEVSWEFLYIH